jgi:threonine dehydratase
MMERVRVVREDVHVASRRIQGHVRWTPLLQPVGADAVWLKCEFLQHCGVFKTRGAFNRQLAALERGEIGDTGICRRVGRQRWVGTCLRRAVARHSRDGFRTAGSPRGEGRMHPWIRRRVRRGVKTGAAVARAYDQLEVAAGAGT